MSKIRILIIEDEPDLAEDLQDSLEEIGYEVTGVAGNLQDAFGKFYSQNPDIVIVDIMLGSQADGIAFVERINENPVRRKPVIFLTGMNDKETFEKAKKTGPFSYLLKPFNILELQFAIELCIEKFVGMNRVFQENLLSGVIMPDSFFIKSGNQLIKLRYDDVLYISVEGKYCDIILPKRKYSIQLSLKDISKELPTHFFQVHRNYLVNLEKVERFNTRDNILQLMNDAEVAVSKRMKEHLMEKLNLLG